MGLVLQHIVFFHTTKITVEFLKRIEKSPTYSTDLATRDFGFLLIWRNINVVVVFIPINEAIKAYFYIKKKKKGWFEILNFGKFAYTKVHKC